MPGFVLFLNGRTRRKDYPVTCKVYISVSIPKVLLECSHTHNVGGCLSGTVNELSNCGRK